MISKLSALVSLFILAHACTACSRPAQAPTAQDVAIVAINTVDSALAAYISSSEADAGVDALFERDVQLVEQAASVVKAGGAPCAVLPGLALVAKDVSCTQCAAPLAAAKEAFLCP